MRLLDARYSLTDSFAGRQAHAAGHIPGAVHVDLSQDLSAEPGTHGGRHPLPQVQEATAMFRSKGVSAGSTVVVYGHGTDMFASRAWWMLTQLGHQNVLVLDGGFAAWEQAGLPVSTEAVTVPAGDFRATVSDWPDVLTRDEVAAALPGMQLMDARSPARFAGLEAAFDPVTGHIPGAVNRHYADNVAGGRLRPPDELRQLYRDLDPDVVAYCGSGVSATLNVLGMTEAGLPAPRVYAGSFSDWISWPDAPVEK